MRAVIAGGGTGGHVFPGLAVAEELKRRDEKAEVVFMGTERGIEAKAVPREGYPIKFIRVEGVLGKGALRKARAIWKLVRAVGESRREFASLRPDIVIGTGGYVSVAPVVAARLAKTPTMVLEQNLMPGFANRMLGRFADAVAVTYHESTGFFPRERTWITGNPVRRAILGGRREEALRRFSLSEGRFTVFIFGGSAGARSINNAMLGALNILIDLKDGIQFLHQTGEQDYEVVRKMYRQAGFTAMAAPFIYEMPEAYAIADLVIARAGATTLAEITAMGKASVLVPYPYAAGHQQLNAEKLKEAGGCRILGDKGLTADALAGAIREMYEAPELRAEMCRQSRALGRPDAAQKVVDIAMSLVRTRKANV